MIAVESLDGLDAAGAKEYVLGYISTLKLTEKELERLKKEEAKWEGRVNLARANTGGRDDLLREAVEERERIGVRIKDLEKEALDLKVQIDNLKEQLALLPARERSVDPDLLQQELLILSGRMPGDEKEVQRDRAFEKLEKDAANHGFDADAALEELKARMGK